MKKITFYKQIYKRHHLKKNVPNCSSVNLNVGDLFRVNTALPNFEAILVKESPSVLILTIVASITSVQLMRLGNPDCTAGLMMLDDFFKYVCHLFKMSFFDRP
jgi:hypothetical protein